MKALAALALSLACAPALAAPECGAFSAALEYSQKRLSMLHAQLRHAAPAAKADLHDRIAHELALLNANVAILVKSSCPLPAKPLRITTYSSAASACILAEVREDASQSAACDMSKWQRDPP